MGGGGWSAPPMTRFERFFCTCCRWLATCCHIASWGGDVAAVADRRQGRPPVAPPRAPLGQVSASGGVAALAPTRARKSTPTSTAGRWPKRCGRRWIQQRRHHPPERPWEVRGEAIPVLRRPPAPRFSQRQGQQAVPPRRARSQRDARWAPRAAKLDPANHARGTHCATSNSHVRVLD